MRVAYLGPPGTYSEQAARRAGATELLPCRGLHRVLAAVAEGEADAGVMPLENSIEGGVNLTLDLLLEREELCLCGEVVLAVRHALAGRGRNLSRVRRVASHPQALAQCRRFLARQLPGVETQETVSTAEAARVAASGGPEWAAICDPATARRYGLDLLAEDIADYPGNKTRFAVVGYGAPPPSGRDKTSLVLALPENRPGGLYSVLREFAGANINLTRIESRPTKRELGEYLFFLDCEGHRDEEPLARVLESLRPRVALLRVFGSYPRDEGVVEGA